MADKEQERETLLQQAVALGLDREELLRKPVYFIQSLIDEAKPAAKERPRSRDRDKSRRGRERRERKRKYAQDRLMDEKAFDDGETVVDMSFMTGSKNPSEQKFRRFQRLVESRAQLMRAIEVNGALVKDTKRLDPDDVQILKEDLANLQEKLGLVGQEAREIYQWFQEMYQEKIDLYQELMGSAEDLNGAIGQHFQRKMTNMTDYLERMANAL